jgi:hypothetical protein
VKDRPADLAILFDEYFALIPKKSSLLDSMLNSMDPKLKNSLGANLAAHQGLLEHILKNAEGKQADRIKKYAQDLYDTAQSSYMQVMPANDALRFRDVNGALTWYRPWLHMQTLSTESIKNIVDKQKTVIQDIERGDRLLVELEKYYAELHDQYFVFVSNHGKTSTTFSHSKEELGYNFFDKKFELQTKYYSTDGYKFNYTLRTQHPIASDDEIISVGEKDEHNTNNYSTWDYAPSEEIGYVRVWKRIHDDNHEIRRDFMRTSKEPFNVTPDSDCVATKVLDFFH